MKKEPPDRAALACFAFFLKRLYSLPKAMNTRLESASRKG